ncbi:MAG: nickel transporter [Burkholderiales bacterium]|nr:nickel transporter [Burkholderiales bacterium]
MADGSITWITLCALAFALGARHGFDADHLATIDGLTRRNARSHPVLARSAGLLFSLGHGSVVLAVALLVATLAKSWQPPEWLETSGVLISAAFLFWLAWANVNAVLRSDPEQVVAMAGLRSKWIARFFAARSPLAIAAVGALFALSFDTISQATLFAVATTRFGGVAEVVAVASMFVVGMLCVDGINGMWISHLIRRADRMAVVASRVLALSVAAISALVGAFALARFVVPAIDAWAEGRDLVFGAAVIATVFGAFCAGSVAVRLSAARAHADGSD